MKYFIILIILLNFNACVKQNQKKQTIIYQNSSHNKFTYYPSGQLIPRSSGEGRYGDNHIYAPNIRFPLVDAPAYINSQVYGIGGLYGKKGSLCDQKNYQYPWSDNYCEKRGHAMPLCQGGKGHQGVDIRAKDCQNSKYFALAVEDGIITYIGSYSIKLRGVSGRTYRYLHLNSHSIEVKRGQSIRRGDKIGLVSNNMGNTKTSIHLHFDIKQTIRFSNGSSKQVYVPPYSSLVDAYKRLLEGRP